MLHNSRESRPHQKPTQEWTAPAAPLCSPPQMPFISVRRMVRKGASKWLGQLVSVGNSPCEAGPCDAPVVEPSSPTPHDGGAPLGLRQPHHNARIRRLKGAWWCGQADPHPGQATVICRQDSISDVAERPSTIRLIDGPTMLRIDKVHFKDWSVQALGTQASPGTARVPTSEQGARFRLLRQRHEPQIRTEDADRRMTPKRSADDAAREPRLSSIVRQVELQLLVRLVKGVDQAFHR